MISGPSEVVGEGSAGESVEDGSVGVGTDGTASDVDAEASGGATAEEVGWAEGVGSGGGAMGEEETEGEEEGDADTSGGETIDEVG